MDRLIDNREHYAVNARGSYPVQRQVDIVGHTADPSQTENWDSDFELLEDSDDYEVIGQNDWDRSDGFSESSGDPFDGFSSDEGDLNNFKESSDEEWDDPILELESKDNVQYFQDFANLLTQTEEKHGIPKRYRVISTVSESAVDAGVRIVKYPKPTELCFMMTEDRRYAYTEKQLESFLTTLTTQYEHLYTRDRDGPRSEIDVSDFNITIPQDEGAIGTWLSDCAERVYFLYSRGAENRCHQLIRVFFAHLQESQNDEIHDDTSKSLDTPQNFLFVYILLYHAIKLGRPDKTFDGFIETSKYFFPSCAAAFDLLRVEAEAHYNGNNANKILRDLVKVYQRCCTAETPFLVETAAGALTSLHLYLCNYSPVTVSGLSEEASWDIESTDFDWLDDAKAQERPKGKVDTENERLTWKLCGSEQTRVELLEEYARNITRKSWLRSRMAFAIGIYYLHRSKGPDCEKVFFECIYVLAKTPPAFRSYAPIISELGTNALILYGEVLLSNHKYKYSILALEAAITSQKCRSRHDDSAEMERRLCDVCTEHEDWDRSLIYHLKILGKSKHDCNVNEFVYISQQISKLFLQHGNFYSAEYYLQNALSFVRDLASGRAAGTIFPGYRSTSNIDSKVEKKEDQPMTAGEFRQARLNLYLKLAQLYVDGNRFDDAIKILRSVLKADLPRGRKVLSVQMLLAKAYMKRMMFDEAQDLMEDIKASCVDGSKRESRNNREKKKIAGSANNYSMGQQLNFLKSPEFCDVLCQILIGAGEFDKALTWSDVALRHCDASRFSYTARFHDLKGRIFQAKCFKALALKQKELTQKSQPPGQGELFHEYQYPPRLSWKDLPDPAECIGEFTTAYTQYRKVNDFTNCTSVLLRWTETYLRILMTAISTSVHEDDHNSASGAAGGPVGDGNGACNARHVLYQYAGWLQKCGFDVGPTEQSSKEIAKVMTLTQMLTQEQPLDLVKCLSPIEKPALKALDHASDSLNVVHLCQCYITMAEIHFLQNRNESSKAYWNECRDTVFAIFVEHTYPVLVVSASPKFQLLIHGIFVRLVRLLFCFESDILAKNMLVLDTFQAFESSLHLSGILTTTTFTKYRDIKERISGSGSNTLRSVRRTKPIRHWQSKSDNGKYRSHAHTISAAELQSTLKRGYSPDTDLQMDSGNPPVSVYLTLLSPLHQRFRRQSLIKAKTLEERAEVLTSKADACLWRVRRNCKLHSAGKLSQSEVHDQNKSSLRKWLKTMQLLRNLSCSDVQQRHEYHQPGEHPSEIHHLSVTPQTNFVTSSFEGNPLAQNLVYLITLCDITVTFHPKSHTKIICERNVINDIPDPSCKLFTASLSQIQTADISNECLRELEGFPYHVDFDNFNQKRLSTSKGRLNGPNGQMEHKRGASWKQDAPHSALQLEDDSSHGSNGSSQSHRSGSQSHRSGSSHSHKPGASPIYNSIARSAYAIHQSTITEHELENSELSLEEDKTFPIPLCTQSPEDLKEHLDPPHLHMISVKELFACLDPQNVIALMAAVLGECSLVFSSDSQARLTACMDAIGRLIYPFSWQFLFVPFLSASNISLLECPTKYMVGIHTAVLDQIEIPPHVVIVRLDSNYIEYPEGAFVTFPDTLKSRFYKVIIRFISCMFAYVRREAAWDREDALMHIDNPHYADGLFGRGSVPDSDADSYFYDPYSNVFSDDIRHPSVSNNSPLDSRPDHKDEESDEDEWDQEEYPNAVNFQFVIPKRSVFLSQYQRTRFMFNQCPGRPTVERRPQHDVPAATACSSRQRWFDNVNLPQDQYTEELLANFRSGIIGVFVTLFFKYHLVWTSGENAAFNISAFIHHSRQENRKFLRGFLLSTTFRNFVALRNHSLAIIDPGLFDRLSQNKIAVQWNKICELETKSHEGWLMFSRAKSRWKKRFVVLEDKLISVYKDKKCLNRKDSIDLLPSLYRVVYTHLTHVPSKNAADVFSPSHSFQLRPVITPGSTPLSSKAATDRTLDFRANSEKDRSEWVRRIRARVLDEPLRVAYKTISQKVQARDEENLMRAKQAPRVTRVDCWDWS